MQTQLVYPKEKSLFAILATLAVFFWLLIIVGTLGIALIYVLMFFILYLFAQSGFISYIKGTAVRITPEQFPDLHARVVACAEKVGLRKVPDAYLLRSDGIFNAFATKFLGRNYIALYAELVDALDDRQEALNFYIGHELGHLHRQHLKYGPFLAPVAWLPLIGAAYSRAREYTCDRYGLLCSASADDAVHAVGVLAAGGRHAHKLNTGAYAGQRNATGGFWMSFHELVGDYPWLVKRLHAVNELGQQREPKMPGRHGLAWLFAFFVPRTGMPSGGGFIVMIAIVGILAAIAIPQFQQYETRAKAAAFMGDGRSVMAHLAANGTTVDEANVMLDALKANPTSLGLSGADVNFGAGGTVELKAREQALQGASLRFSPDVADDDSVSWRCEVTAEGKLETHRLAWCQ
ncbi:M48 family metalloprotease [Chitinimonas sp. BJYL2]|uniref:M48 family metalloprotease n=1 Tax=Chitinimonas sp. BJYL2 TaxID=2976696 RepID=UPI0022B4F0C5|nr:M48 family metalloprotease [Chitinimonas sp. BJYL2]